MNKISEKPITFNQMQGAAFAVDNVAILTDALCTASLKVNEWQALMSLIHTVLEPCKHHPVLWSGRKYSLQGTTQGRYLTGGVPPVRFSM